MFQKVKLGNISCEQGNKIAYGYSQRRTKEGG